MSKLDVADQTGGTVIPSFINERLRGESIMRIESSSGREFTLELKVEALSFQQRLTLGSIRFFTLVVCAALAILLPVVHFFLVPLLLILAPWAGYSSYQKHFKIEPFGFKCPDCQDTIKMDKKYVNIPIEVSCQNCGARLKVN